MKKLSRYIVIAVFISGTVLIAGNIRTVAASATAVVSSPFIYTFNSSGKLKESSTLPLSGSPYWWLNSGAYFMMAGGVGATTQGSLAWNDPWRYAYAASNPIDTDNGYHPQNIFRLLTRSKWQNAAQSVYMKITRDNLSSSPNRNESNGFLLFNRYLDGNNLYYTGIRVDGAAVIKKKKAGAYYTLAYKNIFPGTYTRASNPNMLPKQQWVGIKSELRNNADGSVSIKLYTDVGKRGIWTLALETRDDGRSFGGSALTASGYGGIRTDFMDIQFDDYRLSII